MGVHLPAVIVPALLAVTLRTTAEGGQESCRSSACACAIQQAQRLAALTHWHSANLLQRYMESEELSHQWKEIAGVGAPEVTLKGQSFPEHLESIYSGLKVFGWHLDIVIEHQKNLHQTSSLLLHDFSGTSRRVCYLISTLHHLLQMFHPNGIYSTVGQRPTPKTQSTFKQKIYAYIVLLRFNVFLQQTQQELASFKEKSDLKCEL
ncbi:uncharacterized protein LOC125720488 [Brienomyrus brachyistius]|uniref:uncharacterized protein LOC125720488 n=1 Tax=Brienomyrus brachyistius TaxID=42636 RepID=UPI0020B2114B|nr:uncharacterized protein LOC125720488 [Brienomyrus brachyistius]